MIRLFIRLIGRDIRFHPWIWGLSILGIGVGIAGWVGMETATNRAMSSLKTSISTTVGEATHIVEGQTGRLDESVYIRLSNRYSFSMTPILESAAQIHSPGQSPQQLRIRGIDPLSYPAVRGLSPRQGDTFPVGRMISGNRIAMLSTAFQSDYDRGDTVDLFLGGQMHQYTVGGFVGNTTEQTVYTDIGRAQVDLNTVGQLDRILIREPRIKLDQLRDDLPDDVLITTTGQKSRSVTSLVSAFRWNLRALALLSLFVGGFLVYCSMVLYQSRQKNTFSLLRTLGFTSTNVLWLSLITVMMLGISGTIVGLLMGVTLGIPLSEGVMDTVHQMYVEMFAEAGFNWWYLLGTGFLVGPGIAFLGGLEPVLKNWSIPPRDWDRQQSASHLNRGVLWLFLPLLTLGALLSWGLIAFTSTSLLAGFLACFLVAVCGSIGGVILINIVPRFIHLGFLNRLSLRNLASHGRRTGIIVATLIAAFSMVLAVSIMLNSFRTTVKQWVRSVVRADHYVRTQPLSMRGYGEPFSDQAINDIRSLDGVDDVVVMSRKTVLTDNQRPIQIRGIETEFWRQRPEPLFQFKGTPESPWDTLKDGGVLVSEPGAYRLGKSGGDSLALPVKGRVSEPVTIGGVFNDYSTEWAIVYMDLQQMRRRYQTTTVRDIAVFEQPGADSSLPDRIEQIAQAYGYHTQSGVELRTQAMANFDRTFAVTRFMRIIVSLVAMIGFAVTFVALYRARRREIGLLRSIGFTRTQIGQLMSLETVWLIGYTVIMSVPTGYILSYLLIYVINRRSFGWLMEFHVSPWSLAGIIVSILLAGLVAVSLPLWRVINERLPRLLRQS